MLAALKTGRPVMWEFTREEQFIGATTRHPMTTHVKLGAKQDGTLTAIQVRVVSNTGAYGDHGGETLAAALGSPIAAYRCANKKADGYAVYTNMVPGGGFRGYGASQTTFAIECAVDDLARLLGMNPFEIRRMNKVRRDDRIESIWKDASDVMFGSYGVDQCLDLVETALRSGRRIAQARGRRLAGGDRRRACDARIGPADRAPLRRGDEAAGRRRAIISRSARPRWATARPRRTARSPRRCSARAPADIAIINGDTDRTPYDTGTFASTGTVVAGQAVEKTAQAIRDKISSYASRYAGCDASECRLQDDAVVCANRGFRWPSSMRRAPRSAIAST